MFYSSLQWGNLWSNATKALFKITSPSSMGLPMIESVIQLTPWLVRLLGQNPGPHTLQGTNSYLLGFPGRSRVLIDTTNATSTGLPGFLDQLRKQLTAIPCQDTCALSAIVLTHWHGDHTEGVQAVLDLVGELSTPGQSNFPVVYKHQGGPNLKDLGFYKGPLSHLQDNQLIHIPFCKADDPTGDQLTLRVQHSPGHTEDHVCLWCALGEEPVALFSGDMILGHGSSIVQDLPSYMRSLTTTRKLVDEVLIEKSKKTLKESERFLLLPGHGLETEQVAAKITEYVENRMSRIAKVAEFLNSKAPHEVIRETEILRYVYPQVPKNLIPSAVLNLRHSLFWVAASLDQPLPLPVLFTRAGLLAHLSDGSERPVNVEDYHEFLKVIGSVESASESEFDDVREILSQEWLWQRSD